MRSQEEKDKLLYFPICPKCNEIVSLYYNNTFNIMSVCSICKSNTFLSIEEIQYKTINEINKNLYDILNSFKKNGKIALNKAISILSKLNYIFLI